MLFSRAATRHPPFPRADVGKSQVLMNIHSWVEDKGYQMRAKKNVRTVCFGGGGGTARIMIHPRLSFRLPSGLLSRLAVPRRPLTWVACT